MAKFVQQAGRGFRPVSRYTCFSALLYRYVLVLVRTTMYYITFPFEAFTVNIILFQDYRSMMIYECAHGTYLQVEKKGEAF